MGGPSPRGGGGGGGRSDEFGRNSGGGGGGSYPRRGGGGGPGGGYNKEGGGGPPPPHWHGGGGRDEFLRRGNGGPFRGGGGGGGRRGGPPPPPRGNGDRRGGGGGGGPPPSQPLPPPPLPPPPSQQQQQQHHPYPYEDRVNANPNHISLIQFRSYEEERDWVEERRRKRLARPSKFDILPAANTAVPTTTGGLLPTLPGLPQEQQQLLLQQQQQQQPLLMQPPSLQASSTAAAMASTLPLAPTITASAAAGMLPLMTTMMMGPQQTRHARRLYVGNLPTGLVLTEDFIHNEFLQALEVAWVGPGPAPRRALRGTAHDPILSVYINHERRFCFVEFKTVEMATACMNLDGLPLHHPQAPGVPPVPLKIKRPNDYNELVAAAAAATSQTPIPELDVSRLGIISGNVLDGPNKIFIGGLHYHLTEPQVLELLQAFGKVKAFHLVKGDTTATATTGAAVTTPSLSATTETSKGYCFVEYADPSVTATAIQGLHGMEIGGGKTLTARLAGERSGGGIVTTALASSPQTPVPAAAMAAAAAMSFSLQHSNAAAAAAVALPRGAPPPDRTIVSGYDIEALVDAAMGQGIMPTAPMYMDALGQPLTRIVATTATPMTTTNTLSMILPPPPPPPPVRSKDKHPKEDDDDNEESHHYQDDARQVKQEEDRTRTTTKEEDDDYYSNNNDKNNNNDDNNNNDKNNNNNNNNLKKDKTESIGRILVLHNMVQPQDLESDSEYDSLLDEVREECANYGTLERLEIPRQASALVKPSAVGKIFLQYATREQAQAAFTELQGRQFGTAVVQVTTSTTDEDCFGTPEDFWAAGTLA
ncbi:hypothetical protein ACA910_010290 [Epithemia clementina (nom. ined.)]